MKRLPMTDIVKSGDTLLIIAQQKLGDGNRWHEIKKPDATPYTDADASNLQVGQEICIPNAVAPIAKAPPLCPMMKFKLKMLPTMAR